MNWRKGKFKRSPAIFNDDGLVAVFEIEEERDSVIEMIDDRKQFTLQVATEAVEEEKKKIKKQKYLRGDKGLKLAALNGLIKNIKKLLDEKD